MNLECDPTIKQLQDLVRNCDDSAGHHVLWVKKSGDVELTTVPKDQTLVEFQAAHPDMQIRFETFQAGNEYVGPEAADDEVWVSELLDGLMNKWSQAKGKPNVEHVQMS